MRAMAMTQGEQHSILRKDRIFINHSPFKLIVTLHTVEQPAVDLFGSKHVHKDVVPLEVGISFAKIGT